MLEDILYGVLLVLLIYIGFSVLYLFIFALIGRLASPPADIRLATARFNIAVLVPAYKEDAIIEATVKNILKSNYPPELFRVYIIADSFKKETLTALQAYPIGVIEVSFEKSTKAKALNAAFAKIDTAHDIALICDADNMLEPDFLLKINNAFVNGAHAVQGQRVAKNLDTSYAILDACSEGINNHIFRKAPSFAGLSSAVIGSGMAFWYRDIVRYMAGINAIGGFDKVLQLMIVGENKRIEYLQHALIFDEKVENPEAFGKQRQRWISSQFVYLRTYFIPGIKYLLKGNINYFNLALANNMLVPRAFLIALLPVLALVAFFINTLLGWIAVVLFILFWLSMVLAFPRELWNKDLVKAIMQLPKAVTIMVLSVLKLRKANKTFIHTVHTKTEISNTLFKEQK